MDNNRATQRSDCHSQRQGIPGSECQVSFEQVHFRPFPPHLDTFKTNEIHIEYPNNNMDSNQATQRADCHSQRQGTPGTEGDTGFEQVYFRPPPPHPDAFKTRGNIVSASQVAPAWKRTGGLWKP